MQTGLLAIRHKQYKPAQRGNHDQPHLWIIRIDEEDYCKIVLGLAPQCGYAFAQYLRIPFYYAICNVDTTYSILHISLFIFRSILYRI